MNQFLFLRTALMLSVICVLGGQIMAQDPKPSPTVAPQQQPTAVAPQPAAKPADVSTPDAIIKAVYNVISGPAGKERDWERMKSLFIPGARLIATGRRQAGGYGSRVMTVDDYILSNGPYLIKEGFFENEIARNDGVVWTNSPCLQYLRGTAQARGKAFCERHQQYSTNERRYTLVGGNYLLAGGR